MKFLILILMAGITWGMLAKSLIDPEKIEEAIARIVAEHNDNEEAHLGVGQSLQSHKASEIIDHVVDSIIADKIKDGEVTGPKITNEQIIGKDFETAENVGAEVDGVKMAGPGIEMWQGGEKKVDIPVSGDPFFAGDVSVNNLKYLKYTLQNNWVSLDGLTQYKTLSATILPFLIACVLDSGGTNNSKANLSTWSMGGNPGLDFLKDSVFETRLKLSGYGGLITNLESFFGLGGDHEFGFNPTSQYAVFRYYNGALYAKTNSYVGGEYHLQQTEIVGITMTDPHDFEIRVYAGDRIEYYVDGVLVATHDEYVPSSTGLYSFFWQLQTLSANVRGMTIFSFLFQQEN